jgi:tRNA threonylcarbamoyladenosine modification (KEOPS) complex  Pcc1 subunit
MSCCPPAGIYNIVADQGATLSRVITWRDSARTPYNITGYTARMQVRSTVDSSTVVLELTTANSRISLGGATGQITLTVSATDMAAVTAGKYVYDLELISSGGVVSRLVQGNFVIRAEVTR